MPGEAHRRRLRALLRLAGVRSAGDLAIAENAFVHESHAKERGMVSNERMEFLGDSVLGFVTAGWLYERFGDEPEGLLTLRKAAIVNDAQLATTARRLGFSDVVQLGAGMRLTGGKKAKAGHPSRDPQTHQSSDRAREALRLATQGFFGQEPL